MEEKKNTNKGLIITIIILTILLLGAGGYIVVDKTNILKKEEQTKNETTVKKDTTKTLTEADALEYLIMIEDVYNKYFSAYYPIEDINEISNQTFLSFVMAKQGSLNFTKSDVENLINKYFNGVTIKHEDLICGVENLPLIKYDATTEKYALNENHPGHGGGTISEETKVLFDSGTIKDDEITIKVKIAYARICGDTCSPLNAYYKTYSDASNGKNQVIGDPNSETVVNLDETTLKSLSDKLLTTTFTLEKDGDNYSLKSVTIE